MALVVAIAVGPVAWGYPYRTGKFQFSFSADDWLVDFRRGVADRVVDTEIRAAQGHRRISPVVPLVNSLIISPELS